MRKYILASILFLFAACAIAQVVMLQRRPSSVSAAFSPSDISGLQLWLESDYQVYTNSGTTACVNDGDYVGQWNDRSSGARNVVQTTGTRKPQFTNACVAFNNKPGIWFDGVADRLAYANKLNLNSNQVTIFAVVNIPIGVAVSGKYMFDISSSDVPKHLYRLLYNTNANDGIRFLVYSANTVTTNTTQTSYGIKLTCRSAVLVGDPSTIRTNGILAAAIASPNGNTYYANRVVVGSNYNEDSFGQFGMAAMLVYDSILSDADCVRVENYLTKYAP